LIDTSASNGVSSTPPIARETPLIPTPAIPAPAEPALPISNEPNAAEPEAKVAEPEAKAFETKTPEPPKATEPAPAVKTKILASEPATPSLTNERPVVPPQPKQSNKPVLPTPNGSSKESESMNKENNPQFDTLVLDVAHIIFGDNAPDINVRLVRMALEQVWKNRNELQTIDAIAREIARIIFGDTNTSDLNVRLVKMALEHSNSIALFKAA
jgi:hypothetical protein